MNRRRRGLSPEDQELWGRVVQTARPLKSDYKPLLPPDPAPAPVVSKKPTLRATPETARGIFRPTSSRPAPGHDLAHPLSEALSKVPVKMDKRKFQRLSRGKLDPEARIDLHGMTLAQAHGVLNGFILRAQSQGLRLVLVITGKGKTVSDDGPIPRRQGALKHDVPQWLRMAPLNGCVLEIREAHARHGGSGAYYVYLRKTRA